MLRIASRAIRSPARGFSTAVNAGENDFVAKRAAVKAHAAETTDLWRKISFYVCIPGVMVGALWTYKVESAHLEHQAHAPAPSEKPVFSYMNIRTKPFPWGNQSLFYNPKVNIPANSQE
ncbi:hypothetical protein L204_101016 [Cryptococcus depauperatus]|nr:cytochrome c oxidase subunit 6a [Cryptococcus depauperatus CBS 7855]